MTDLQTPPKAIDWDYIQALYMQGIGPAEIARKTGVKADTISVRATRHGWTGILRKTGGPRQDVQITVSTEQPKEDKLAKQSERTRTALADVIARSAEKLAAMPINTPSSALRVNQDAESMVRNAKTVFGWSEGQSAPAVRINILGNATVASEEMEKPPVIDLPPSV